MSKNVSDARVLSAQILAAMVKNVLLVIIGMGIAYPTILIPSLLKETEINLTITKNDISWIASTELICIILGSIGSGVCTQYLGRKRFMQVLTVPLCIIWLTFTFCNQIWQVYLGLALYGICQGLVESPVMSYVAEVTQPRLRGILSATNTLSVMFGVFLEFCLGTLLSWRNAACASTIVPICAFILLCFIPESPHWLMMHNKLKKTQKSLAWLRGWTNIENVNEEFQEMCRNHSMAEDQKDTNVNFNIRNYFKKNFYRPLLLVSFVAFLSTFSGFMTLQTYAVSIFHTLQVPINEFYATIILGVVQFIGCSITIVLIKYCGKRIMIFISMIGLAICECVVGFYAYSKNTNNLIFRDEIELRSSLTETRWIPLTFLILLSFFGSCGLRSLPWILICEIYTHETRALLELNANDGDETPNEPTAAAQEEIVEVLIIEYKNPKAPEPKKRSGRQQIIKAAKTAPNDASTYPLRVWNFFSVLCLLLYYSALLYVSTTSIIRFQFGIACSFASTMEVTRLLMKVHSFVRSNVPKVLRHKPNKDKQLYPKFYNYLYFLFAPTAIYQDVYPRNKEKTNWKNVVTGSIEFLIGFVLLSYIFDTGFVRHLQDFGLKPFPPGDIIMIIFQSFPYGLLIVVTIFYLGLHVWLNVFSEMLGFSDRLFYKVIFLHIWKK
ncbi:hypothetical protein RN001_008715 [Aquatica leii]|uniref:Major facilitator superfamily (MFS) profile domain-containing protein n=1 Tax=Aquatica leii TaxID=1421715 RepID=A0AAN7PAN8_9COLE|nr:hypothetical protein RN001_008715 [Aquatica leii]